MTAAPEPSTVPPLRISPKQLEGMELCRNKKFVLFSGPRFSSKTCCAIACVCDHAWNTDGANAVIVSVSQSAGMESGVWEDLTNSTIPQYISAQEEQLGPGNGMRWVKKPYIASVSKKPACMVSNKFGTSSRIQLESLKYEHEVEERFKAKRYSMMYIPELSNFRKRKTFDIWAESLRMLHLREDQHLFLADTNPADDGEDSWIYILWYVVRTTEYEEYLTLCGERGLPKLPEKTFKAFRNSLGLMEFMIEDNIFASPERVDELIARYSHDMDLYNRYIKGIWVKATTDALFASVFRSGVHVIGEVGTTGNPDPMILMPEDSCFELITGWDPGSSSNSAAVIIEKFFKVNDQGRTVACFKILDELCVIDEEHTIDDFTERFVEKMRWWEERCGRQFIWRHWSDRSVFDMKEPRENRYYHQLIHAASGGLVTLVAADRGPGSVRQRVDLMKRLMFEDRIFFSADRCSNAVTMCKSIRRGPGELSTIQKASPYKHVFDAIMYGVASECYDELSSMVLDMLKQSRKTHQNGVVSVRS